MVHDALERGLPVIVISPQADTTPKLLGAAGETSFSADLLGFSLICRAPAARRRPAGARQSRPARVKMKQGCRFSRSSSAAKHISNRLPLAKTVAIYNQRELEATTSLALHRQPCVKKIA